MTSRPPRRRRRRRPLGAEPLEGVGDFVPGEHCASRERSSSGSMSGPAALDPSRATGGTSHESVDKVRLPRAIRVKNKAPAGALHGVMTYKALHAMRFRSTLVAFYDHLAGAAPAFNCAEGITDL